MGEATNEIEAHIENTRANLGSNLQELEKKVKSVTDWKQHFQNSPMTMVGVAFGGGILLATMLGGHKGKGARSFPHRLPAATPMQEVIIRDTKH